MPRLLNSVLEKLDPFKPLARRVLPAPMLDRAERTWKSLQARRILAEPDRHFLSEQVLPALGVSGPVRVYFVGVRAYTGPFLNQLSKAGHEVWTSDIDPAARAHGAGNRHLTFDITQAPPPTLPRDFNAVIMNGVFGYGVDDNAACRRALLTLRSVLAEDGRLLIGWNTDRCPNLIALCESEGWRPADLNSLPQSVSFPETTHRFDSFRR